MTFLTRKYKKFIKIAQFIHVIHIFKQNDFLVALISELALQKSRFFLENKDYMKIFYDFYQLFVFSSKKKF